MYVELRRWRPITIGDLHCCRACPDCGAAVPYDRIEQHAGYHAQVAKLIERLRELDQPALCPPF